MRVLSLCVSIVVIMSWIYVPLIVIGVIMNSELRDKLSTFTVSDTPNLTYLRDRFSGCTIDNSKLAALGYQLIKSDKGAPWQLWAKYYNRKTRGYALKVSLDGRLGALEHFRYIDLRDDFGFMSPCGYIRMGDVSDVIKRRIDKELAPLVSIELPSTFDDAAMFYARSFFPDSVDKWDPTLNKELLVNSMICEFNEKRQLDRLAYVGLGLSKFINSFTDLDFTIF